jgi:hypothetical protein
LGRTWKQYSEEKAYAVRVIFAVLIEEFSAMHVRAIYCVLLLVFVVCIASGVNFAQATADDHFQFILHVRYSPLIRVYTTTLAVSSANIFPCIAVVEFKGFTNAMESKNISAEQKAGLRR